MVHGSRVSAWGIRRYCCRNRQCAVLGKSLIRFWCTEPRWTDRMVAGFVSLFYYYLSRTGEKIHFAEMLAFFFYPQWKTRKRKEMVSLKSPVASSLASVDILIIATTAHSWVCSMSDMQFYLLFYVQFCTHLHDGMRPAFRSNSSKGNGRSKCRVENAVTKD